MISQRFVVCKQIVKPLLTTIAVCTCQDMFSYNGLSLLDRSKVATDNKVRSKAYDFLEVDCK